MASRQNISKRCPWADGSEQLAEYHDTEWGVPEHDDRRLFELISLEGAQAGLSWATILRKRARYREVFDGFDWAEIARYTPAKVRALVADPGIVRHRGKIESVISNARLVPALIAEFGSIDAFVWRHAGSDRGRPAPAVNSFRTMADVPSSTPASAALSKELARRGFRFVGPTTCYAFMQAAGLVNDHLVGCPRRAACSKG